MKTGVLYLGINTEAVKKGIESRNGLYLFIDLFYKKAGTKINRRRRKRYNNTCPYRSVFLYMNMLS